MHIEKILLRDVGPFDDVTIDLPKGNDPQLADVYLLTGPNGTGKSTILYALASVIAGKPVVSGYDVELGRDLLATRMRSANALVAFRTDDGQTFAASHPERPPEDVNHLVLRDPFDGRELRQTWRGDLEHWETDNKPPRYSQAASGFRTDRSAAHLSFAWAAFAYAGVRSVSDVEIAAVKEPKNSPFENSLSFIETADTNQLANWIASQNFRRLKAKEAGNDQRAEQLTRSIHDIESVIAEIVDDPGFAFVITDQDDDVRVRWKGAVVRLGLLPDGLKSIVSWVADLLMRLNRIPWQDNEPVLQRRFLLLLDEVDIHLHPAWQRKVLPLVQRVFPNAQIIASTHSPFVVTSVDDACVITLGFRGNFSDVTAVSAPQIGTSYTAVLRSLFGITSEFDVDTEQKFARFHDAKQRLLAGDAAARTEIEQIAGELEHRSDELRELIALERAQLRRQEARRAAP
jgi:energy-coupling factor transporter ATP-binding protein EcfA2